MAEPFELYEGILWEPGRGYFLLERHLKRLARSAAHFGFRVDLPYVRAELLEFGAALAAPRKVRLELFEDGGLHLEEVAVKPSAPVRAALAAEPVDSRDEFLRHKTSRRGVYEKALAARPRAQDVLLWNERGELTDTSAGNVVLELDGRRTTPHAASGLLPGTFRAELLARGEIEEAVLPTDALARAARVWFINSVRRWCDLRVEPA